MKLNSDLREWQQEAQFEDFPNVDDHTTDSNFLDDDVRLQRVYKIIMQIEEDKDEDCDLTQQDKE